MHHVLMTSICHSNGSSLQRLHCSDIFNNQDTFYVSQHTIYNLHKCHMSDGYKCLRIIDIRTCSNEGPKIRILVRALD